MKDAEYDEFEISGGDTVPEMASNNPIGPSTNTPNTPTSKTPCRRLRSLVWQHFRQVDATDNGKKVIKAICKYCKKIFTSSTNGTSHLKRHADKCVAKNLSNVGTSQSQINFTKGGVWVISLILMLE